MASRSHLTPVSITDRRGRTTTVYRKPGSPAPGPRSTPPPAPAACPPAPERTPLPAVPIRSRVEIDAFEQAMGVSLETLLTAYQFLPKGIGSTGPEAAAAISLALDLVESGALDFRTAAFLVFRATGGKKLSGLTSDVLRVAARLRAADAGQESGNSWALRVCHAVAGLSADSLSAPASVTTAEELESCAAVARFVLDADADDALTAQGYAHRRQLPVRRIRNRGLERLLRERPAELLRITAYVRERGMADDSPAAVEDLRAWLDSETPALRHGWL